MLFAVGNIYRSDSAFYELGVSRTTDGGQTWVHETIPAGSNLWTVAFDPLDSNRVLIGGDTNWSNPALLVSTDLGLTWTSGSQGLAGRVNVILPNPLVPGCCFCGTQNGLYRSTDSARTWTSVWSGGAVRAVAYDSLSDVFYIGTSVGVSLTSDGGATWLPVNDGLTNTSVLSLALSFGSGYADLFAGTEGAGVFRRLPLVGVADRGAVASACRSPASVSVSPSPCRGLVRVTLRLAEPGKVQGGIFDRTGRMVQSLNAGQLPAGTWNLRSDLRRLPAGSYFIRLRAGASSLTARFAKIE